MDVKRAYSRRAFLQLSGVLGGSVLMSACAPATGSATGAGSAAGETAANAEAVEVRWWSRGTPEWQEAMQSITDAYLEENPDQSVLLEIMPTDRYDDKIFTSAAAGTLADMFHANSEMVASFAVKQVVMDVTDLLENDADVSKDDWYDWAWDRALYQNKIYALPQKGNTVLTTYNKTLYDQAGVPYPQNEWNWADYVETASALTDLDNNQWGSWVFPWHVAVWENGGDIITEDGQTCILDQPEAYEAIQWVADLSLVEGVAPRVEEQGIFDNLNPFMSGRVATYIEGESNIGTFIQNIEDFEWAAAWVPTGKELYSEGTATMFCLYQNTTAVDQAWDFLKFLCADMRAYEVLNDAAKLGIPPLKAALEELFLGTEPRPDVKQVLSDMAQINRIWMRNVTAGAEVKTTVDQGLSRVWSGDQSAEEVCVALAAQVNEILAAQPR